MRISSKKYIKLISWQMAAIFLFQTIAWSAPANQSIVASRQSLEKMGNNLFIPEQYGKIKKSVKDLSPSARDSLKQPTIVLIKDAHCHYEAQRNIVKILNILIKDYKVDLIGVEGASGKVDPSVVAGSTDEKRRKEVADKYLKKGYLTASEVLAMEKGKDYGFSIWGVEDLKLYLNDLKAFRDVYSGSEVAERFIDIGKGLISGLKNKLYAQEILDFDKKIKEYKDNRLSLTELIKYLYTIDSQRFVKYPNLKLVLKALSLEKAIDFKKVEGERAELIKETEKKLPKEELETLVRKSLEYRLGKISSSDYYTYLEQFIKFYNLKLTTYNLKRYIRNIKIHSKIDEINLFKELDKLIEDIYRNSIKDEIAWKLYETDEYTYLLNKLLRLEITRDELTKYREKGIKPLHIVEFLKIQGNIHKITIPNEFTDEDFIRQVEGFYIQPEEFYRYAIERDDAIIENLIKKMKDTGKGRAALVVGGFHADGVEKLLRDKGMQVITISPSITKEDPEAKKIYLSRMLDKNLQPDNLLENSGLSNLSAPDIFDPVLTARFEFIIDSIGRELSPELKAVLERSRTPEEFINTIKGEMERLGDTGADRVTHNIYIELLKAAGALVSEPSASESNEDDMWGLLGMGNWLATNEEWETHLEAMRDKKGVYLGLGYGGQNLSRICQGDFELGIIVDINPFVTEGFLPIRNALISMTNSRAEYLSLLGGIPLSQKEIDNLKGASLEAIEVKLRQKKQVIDSKAHTEIIKANWVRLIKEHPELQSLPKVKAVWDTYSWDTRSRTGFKLLPMIRTMKRGESWLANETNFLKIKEMIENKKIVAVSADWLSTDFVGKIKAELARHNLSAPYVSVVCISNIPEWVAKLQDPKETYTNLNNNIESLPHTENSVFLWVDFKGGTNLKNIPPASTQVEEDKSMAGGTEGPAVTASGSAVAGATGLIGSLTILNIVSFTLFGTPSAGLIYTLVFIALSSIPLLFQAEMARKIQKEKGIDKAATPEDSYREIRQKFRPIIAPQVYIHELVHRYITDSEFIAYIFNILFALPAVIFGTIDYAISKVNGKNRDSDHLPSDTGSDNTSTQELGTAPAEQLEGPEWIKGVKIVETDNVGNNEIKFLGPDQGSLTRVQEVEYKVKGASTSKKYFTRMARENNLPVEKKFIIPQARILHYLNKKGVPGICKAEHFLELENGRKVILLEKFPEGETLEDRTNRLGKIPERQALEITIKIAGIVKSLLDNGVYHWDLKPDNIWITDDNDVILFDFDFAFITKQEFIDRELWRVGTRLFMSANRRTYMDDLFDEADIGFSPSDEMFSLSVSLVYMLLGTEFFQKYLIDVLLDDILIGKREIPKPKWLTDILYTTLRTGKCEYKTIDEFINALERVLREKFPDNEGAVVKSKKAGISILKYLAHYLHIIPRSTKDSNKNRDSSSLSKPSISSTGVGNEDTANRNIFMGVLNIALKQEKIDKTEYERRIRQYDGNGISLSDDIELDVDKKNIYTINGQRVIVIDNVDVLSTTEEGEQYASAGLRRGVVYITRKAFDRFQEEGTLEQIIRHEQAEVEYLRKKALEMFRETPEYEAYEQMSRFLKDTANTQQAKSIIKEAHDYAEAVRSSTENRSVPFSNAGAGNTSIQDAEGGVKGIERQEPAAAVPAPVAVPDVASPPAAASSPVDKEQTLQIDWSKIAGKKVVIFVDYKEDYGVELIKSQILEPLLVIGCEVEIISRQNKASIWENIRRRKIRGTGSVRVVTWKSLLGEVKLIGKIAFNDKKRDLIAEYILKAKPALVMSLTSTIYVQRAMIQAQKMEGYPKDCESIILMTDKSLVQANNFVCKVLRLNIDGREDVIVRAQEIIDRNVYTAWNNILIRMGIPVNDKPAKECFKLDNPSRSVKIFVNPFSSTPAKDYNYEKLKEVLKMLIKKYGDNVEIIVDCGEKGKSYKQKVAYKIVENIKESTKLNVIEAKSQDLQGMIQEIRECDIFISPDTFSLHAAAALGKINISLWPVRNEESVILRYSRWMPRGIVNLPAITDLSKTHDDISEVFNSIDIMMKVLRSGAEDIFINREQGIDTLRKTFGLCEALSERLSKEAINLDSLESDWKEIEGNISLLQKYLKAEYRDILKDIPEINSFDHNIINLWMEHLENNVALRWIRFLYFAFENADSSKTTSSAASSPVEQSRKVSWERLDKLDKDKNFQQDIRFLEGLGVIKGSNIVSVGNLDAGFQGLAASRLGSHYKGFDLNPESVTSIQKAWALFDLERFGGSAEQTLGEFSNGPNSKSKNIKDNSQDVVLILTGALSDPLPESNADEVFLEVLRVIKSGGKIVVGTVGRWEGGEKLIAEEVMHRVKIFNLGGVKKIVKLTTLVDEVTCDEFMRGTVYQIDFLDIDDTKPAAASPAINEEKIIFETPSLKETDINGLTNPEIISLGSPGERFPYEKVRRLILGPDEPGSSNNTSWFYEMVIGTVGEFSSNPASHDANVYAIYEKVEYFPKERILKVSFKQPSILDSDWDKLLVNKKGFDEKGGADYLLDKAQRREDDAYKRAGGFFRRLGEMIKKEIPVLARYKKDPLLLSLTSEIFIKLPTAASPDVASPPAESPSRAKIDNLLSKFIDILNTRSLEDGKQLGFEIFVTANVILSIQECFQKGWSDEASKIAVAAIQANIPGITAEDVKRWIQECFQKEWPYAAGKIVIAAIQANIPSIPAEDVKRSIQECFQKRLSYAAGKIAIAAIQANIRDIPAEDVKRSIQECLQQGRPDVAGKIAIAAIQANITSITAKDIKRWIQEYFQKGWSGVGEIAVAAIQANITRLSQNTSFFQSCKNAIYNVFKWCMLKIENLFKIKFSSFCDSTIPGITAEDVKRWIQECFQECRPYEAGKIAVAAIQANIPGITAKYVKRSIKECFQKGRPQEAGKIAIAAIQANIPRITARDVKKWIKECFQKGRPQEAGKIAIAAIQANIPSIPAEDVKRSIQECQPYEAGEIAIAAIQANITDITAEDVKRSIQECFLKGVPDAAGRIAIAAIQANIPGITAEDVKRSIQESFQGAMPDLAAISTGKIAVAAIQANIPGVTAEDVKRWIQECSQKIRPDAVGKIAVAAAGKIKFSKKIEKAFNFLNNNQILPKESLLLTTALIGYALEHNQLNNLPEALISIKHNQKLLPMLEFLFYSSGVDEITGEILKNGGVDSFVRLYERIYPHIFADLLPDDIDISEGRVNILLDFIIYFRRSKFERNDLSIKEIYEQYRKDYQAGKIKQLPENIPHSRVIEVATTKSQTLSVDMEKYYDTLMQSVRKALSELTTAKDKTSLPQEAEAGNLLTSIDQRINDLARAGTKEGLSQQVIGAIDKQIGILQEAREIISSSLEKGKFVLLQLNKEHFIEIGLIKNTAPILRTLLFIHSLKENSSWQEHFRNISSQPASMVGIKKFVEFVDSFVKPHILDTMQKDARKELVKYAGSKPFKEEIDRLSSTKGELTKKIRITATRGWIGEFVGYFSDECWTKTQNILRDNPDTIVLVFSDEATGDILGGTLLMPNSINGTKVIIDRGLSPRTEVTTRLNMDDFMRQVTDYEEDIARVLGAEMILVPLRGLEEGLGSNNPDIIQYYKRTLSTQEAVDLDTPNNFNGHDITSGRCVVLRAVKNRDSDHLPPDTGARNTSPQDARDGMETSELGIAPVEQLEEPEWITEVKIVETDHVGDNEIKFSSPNWGVFTRVQEVEYKVAGESTSKKYFTKMAKEDYRHVDVEERYIIPQARILHYLNKKGVSGICKAEHFLELKNGRKVILFEKFTEGETLEHRIGRLGKISEREAFEITIKIASIVKSLLDNGVYHWDLKPRNIWITDDNDVILFDFDFAFITKQEFVDRELWRSGTTLYMSANRQTYMRTLSYQADIGFSPSDEMFSLSVSLVEMLSGAKFFQEFPKWLADILHTTLRTGKCEYKTIDEFINALERVLRENFPDNEGAVVKITTASAPAAAPDVASQPAINEEKIIFETPSLKETDINGLTKPEIISLGSPGERFPYEKVRRLILGPDEPGSLDNTSWFHEMVIKTVGEFSSNPASHDANVYAIYEKVEYFPEERILKVSFKQPSILDSDWDKLLVNKKGFDEKGGADYLLDKAQRREDDAYKRAGGFFRRLGEMIKKGIPVLVRYKKDPLLLSLTSEIFIKLPTASSPVKDKESGKAGYDDKDSNPQIKQALESGDFACVDGNLASVNNVGPHAMKQGNELNEEERGILEEAISKLDELDDKDRKILEGLLIIFISGLSAHYSRQKYNQIYFDRNLLSNPRHIEDLKWQLHHEVQEWQMVRKGVTVEEAHARLIREELRVRFKINIEDDLDGVLAQRARDLLRVLTLDGEISEEEIRVVSDKARMATEMFNQYKKYKLPEGFGARLDIIQEILAMTWAMETLSKSPYPEFLQRLADELKKVADDPNMVDNLINEIYKMDGYYVENKTLKISRQFQFTVSWLKTTFGIEDDTLFKNLNKYMCAKAQAKSGFEVKDVSGVNTWEMFKVVEDYIKYKREGVTPEELRAKIADITARYITEREDLLNTISADQNNKRRKFIDEGLRMITKGKGISEDKIIAFETKSLGEVSIIGGIINRLEEGQSYYLDNDGYGGPPVFNKEGVIDTLESGRVKVGDAGIKNLMDFLHRKYILLDGNGKARQFLTLLFGLKGIENLLDKEFDKDELKWKTDMALIVEAKTLIGKVEESSINGNKVYSIEPRGEGAVWLIKKRAEQGEVQILYDGTKEEKEATKSYLLAHGVKIENVKFIEKSDYPTEGKAVCLFTDETVAGLKIAPEHRVINCKENTDMILASRGAAILGSYEDLNDSGIRESFIKLYRAFGMSEDDIDKYVNAIVEKIKQGVNIVIELPPMTAFVKVYYNTLKNIREIVASAA